VLLAELDADTRSSVDLLEMGCGRGRSLISAERRFGVQGIGLERNPRAVAEARAAGLRVYEADLLLVEPDDLPPAKYVSFDNVLEHMPDLDTIESVLGVALRHASRLVHVRHPSFDDVEYLASLGLKQYWTDWNVPGGHTAPAKVHELVAMANRLGVYRVLVHPVRRMVDSSDHDILPSSAPSMQMRAHRGEAGVYLEDVHGPKPRVTFDRPVYYAFDVLFFTGPKRAVPAYLHDPEVHANRPFFLWEGEPPPRLFLRWGGALPAMGTAA
jgi:hypothetical protein